MIYTNPNIRASSRDGYVIATFIADTVAELPPLNYLSDYTLEIGSTCHVIEDSGDYEMQSDGTWVKRIPAVLANTYTRTEIDSRFTTVNDDIEILAGLHGTDRQIIIDMINSGGKNILPISNPLQSETKHGVTATYDFLAGTVTLNGTHDGNGDATFYLYTGAAVDSTPIPAGEYHLSGCPAGGSTSTYCLIVNGVGGSPTYKLDTGNGKSFTITDTGYMAAIIRIRTGTYDNMIFRPMITPQIIYDISPDFRPYCPTLQQLYAIVQSYHGGV